MRFFSFETEGDYPWSVYEGACLISGNKNVNSSISVMKLTLTGPGTLCFDYRVYSLDMGSGDGCESNPDSLLVSVGTPISASTSYSSFGGQRYYGYDTGWNSVTLQINAEENESTDVYFAYKKNGSNSSTNDCALLMNFAFNCGYVTVAASSGNETYGTVSGGGEHLAGDNVTLSATPKEGGKFFGWVRNGQLISEKSTEYTFVAGTDVNITAMFGSADNTVAQNRTDGTVYESVSEALSCAGDGDVILLLKDCRLTENSTIGENVRLFVPYCEEFDADGNADGTTANLASSQATTALTFITLTIDSGVNLNVCGSLLIGGVMSYPSQQYQGHTSGAHGRITNNGTITVNGGRIECYGFIDGSGTVEAYIGDVFEPFLVLDFAGGSNCYNLYMENQNSFRDYTMQNISCTLIIHDTAALNAYCNLYASSQYNKTVLSIIGGQSTAPLGLIVLSQGSVLTRTVDKTKHLSGAVGAGTYGSDLGKVTCTVSGGAMLGKLSIEVYGFSISVDNFPIPYSYKYILQNGTYTMPTGWDIMPGAELIIEQDAVLNVSGRLMVPDGLKAGDLSGKSYPSSEELQNAGYSACGVLVVDGTLNLAAKSVFGGIIQTNGTGIVTVDQTCTVKNPSVQFGAVACYDDITCIVALNGRLRLNDELITMVPGATYIGNNGSQWTLESYALIEYATDITSATRPETGKWAKPESGNYTLHIENETVIINQTMSGEFEKTGIADEFTFVNKTIYDSCDNTRTVIGAPTLVDGDAKFNVTRTEDGANYNYIVQYSMNGSALTTIYADKTTGLYTIPSVNGEVTIFVTSVLKGDVNLDGEIAGNDVTKIRRYLAGYTQTLGNEYNVLAADVNGDGEIAGNDVTKLRRFLAGYTNSLK